MRMFLVGMCDIFLLLYLTAVAQHDPRSVSALTVKDYVQLKASREELNEQKVESDRRAAEQESALAAAMVRLRDLEEQMRAAAEERGRQVQEVSDSAAELEAQRRELAGREESLKQLSVRINELEKERERLAAGAAKSAGELEQLKKAAAQKDEAAAAARQLAEAAAAERSRFEQLARAAQESAEEQRRRMEQAEVKAREAEEAAEKAEQSARESAEMAEAARRGQTAAELAAVTAERREAAAASARREAEQAAEFARFAAREEAGRAARSEDERRKVQTKIAAITQSAERAYQGQVARNVLALIIETRSRGLFGERSARKTLSGVPVRLNGEHVFFQPLEQTGLTEAADDDALERLTVGSEGRKAVKLYLSPEKPWIVGFAFGEGGKGAQLSAAESLSGYMPTLIAVRNGSRLGFGDRMRNVDEARFVFQRDRLRPDARGFLRYQVEGLRGTSDFAEYLVQGDQIVDLEGRFIGLAAEENLIVPIRSLKGWRSADLQRLRPRDALRALGLPRD